MQRHCQKRRKDIIPKGKDDDYEKVQLIWRQDQDGKLIIYKNVGKKENSFSWYTKLASDKKV